MLRFLDERKPESADLKCIKVLYTFFTGYCLNDLDDDSTEKAIDADSITEYKSVRASMLCRGKPISNATIRRDLSTLSSAINYARFEWNWKIPNYVEGRKPTQVSKWSKKSSVVYSQAGHVSLLAGNQDLG